MKTIEKKLQEAKTIKTHGENGILNPHFFLEKEYEGLSKTLYGTDDSPANLFLLLNPYQPGAQRYYIIEIPTYYENGNLKKQEYWDKKLMFHKAWAKTDIEVKKVSYDIVGLRRETTHLPAGVVIANIKFIH